MHVNIKLPGVNLNITLTLMQCQLVPRGILTQAQKEIDSPHGLFRGFGPRHPAAVVSVSEGFNSRLPCGKLTMPTKTPAFKRCAELLCESWFVSLCFRSKQCLLPPWQGQKEGFSHTYEHDGAILEVNWKLCFVTFARQNITISVSCAQST